MADDGNRDGNVSPTQLPRTHTVPETTDDASTGGGCDTGVRSGGDMGARAATEPIPGDVSALIPDFCPGKFRYSRDLIAGKVLEAEELTGFRRQCLRTPLANEAQAKIFRMSFDEWKTVDRSTLPGWRLGVRGGGVVPLRDLTCWSKEDCHVLDRICIHRGAVTQLEVDAIVNAANEGCLGGGGVDGAVHDAAGPLLERECCTFDGCETGHVRITKGYGLPARFVLHAVGPMGEKPAVLARVYRNCLALAHHHGLRTIAFCCISTGIFGYPLHAATTVALTEVMRYVKQHREHFDLVTFACFTHKELDVYNAAVEEVYRNVMSEPLTS